MKSQSGETIGPGWWLVDSPIQGLQICDICWGRHNDEPVVRIWGDGDALKLSEYINDKYAAKFIRKLDLKKLANEKT